MVIVSSQNTSYFWVAGIKISVILIFVKEKRVQFGIKRLTEGRQGKKEEKEGGRNRKKTMLTTKIIWAFCPLLFFLVRGDLKENATEIFSLKNKTDTKVTRLPNTKNHTLTVYLEYPGDTETTLGIKYYGSHVP